MTKRPRSLVNDMIDAVETSTAKWTRQKKAEERHPGLVRYRISRLTKESRVTQKAAAWEVMEAAYMAASGGGRLPASARQIYYQARPKIMAATDEKALDYNYFSQTLLPNYIEEQGVGWDVVYDARGHLIEPHSNRRIGCGTIEIDNYLAALKAPEAKPADFGGAYIDIIGPRGGFAGVLFCEKEGFNPLFRAVNLANRYDLMIISTKGVSVTAARKLIDVICGRYRVPLFTLHDFDVAAFLIRGVLQRDTRRYRFSNSVQLVDLGLRLGDVDGLESEPAAMTKTNETDLRRQLAENGATPDEIDFLLTDHVELNALTSDALIEMIERKLDECGLQKVVPDSDVLADAYRAFHRSHQLREKFEDMVEEFDEASKEVEVPADLGDQVRDKLAEHPELRWDDAVQLVLDPDDLDRMRDDKEEAKRKSGDFTDSSHDEDDDVPPDEHDDSDWRGDA
jgi:hypothetical protein